MIDFGAIQNIYAAIVAPSDEGDAMFIVQRVSDTSWCFVGKDTSSCACLLIAARSPRPTTHPPIRLEWIEANFHTKCSVRAAGDAHNPRTETFTVLRCRAADTETVRYFLSICEVLVRVLGENPTDDDVADAITRLAVLFQRRSAAPSRAISGLFGELWLIRRSRSPATAVKAWRLAASSRFDFVYEDVRLDVKTTARRTRLHTVSYEQCNPPVGTVAVFASLFVERVSSGPPLRSLIDDVERTLTGSPDLALKLHEVVAETLGSGLDDGLQAVFDVRLAESSLQFFDALKIPAIRGQLPPGVGDLHLQSDFTVVEPVPIDVLRTRSTAFQALLP